MPTAAGGASARSAADAAAASTVPTGGSLWCSLDMTGLCQFRPNAGWRATQARGFPVGYRHPIIGRMRRNLTRVLPWLITAGILAYLFSRLPVGQVLHAAGNAASWTIPVLAGVVLLVYLADCLAIWMTFGWFVAPLTFRETLTL